MGQTSTSSESDSPPAAKRHRSRSLQRHPSRSNDTSDFSNAESPAKEPGQHAAASKQNQKKEKSVSRQQARGRVGASSLPTDSHFTEHDAASTADRQQVVSSAGNAHPAQSKAAGLANAGAAVTNAEDTSNMHDDGESTHGESDDGESEPDVEGDGMPQEVEEGPAFELPSQMPRELQSWAWDK